jgi:hypothetical protein
MSVINNVERYMKRYDYLMEKRERRSKQGKRLSEDEDEELRKLRPNVFTPIMMMFEVLHDTVKTNQEVRQRSSSAKQRKINQTGGATPPGSESPTPPASPSKKEAADANVLSEEAATLAATAAATTLIKNAASPPPAVVASAPPLDEDDESNSNSDDNEGETRRLSELEESLLPLLTKIIVYIEENKKAEKKKDGEEEEEDEKYPDIGTTAKNSAILVIRRIKKWWNDLISGGTSDLSSKINLKKAIPQLANNPADMNNLNAKAEELNKLAETATDAIHGPLQKIERILSNDVRDIASSSVEGIMNALSLIPGIGTTLQLWRLLQNVIVIMSKSVTTMAGAKTQGVALKTNIQGLQGEFQKMAEAKVNDTANAAAGNALSQAQGAIGGGADPMAAMNSVGAGANPLAALNSVGAGANPLAAMNSVGAGANPLAAMNSAIPTGPAGAMNMLKQQGGGSSHTSTSTSTDRKNHLRTTKKYKREYKQSLRDIKKTRKNILRIIKNMI